MTYQPGPPSPYRDRSGNYTSSFIPVSSYQSGAPHFGSAQRPGNGYYPPTSNGPSGGSRSFLTVDSNQSSYRSSELFQSAVSCTSKGDNHSPLPSAHGVDGRASEARYPMPSRNPQPGDGGAAHSTHYRYPPPRARSTENLRDYRPNDATQLLGMATDPPTSLAPHKFQKIVLLKDRGLGSGSYGAVYKARCENTLTCAAKVIHQALLTGDPEARSPQGRFRQECEILSSLRHPNVVQYLGTHVDAENNLLLLMELMDQSLTQFLDESGSPLPFHTQVNICHDISLALSFLHSKGIIHRDLSSNNVLMIGDRRAKVTDFGMAKWRAQSSMRATQQTSCPGTKVYMPPEALDEAGSVYNSSIDCFSLGVLAIQIITRRFPCPGGRQHRTYSSSNPNDVKVEEVSEINRRSKDIDSIDGQNSIKPVALRCLSSNPEFRPEARELSFEFEHMKESGDFHQSMRNHAGANIVPARVVTELERALSAQRDEMERLRREKTSEEARMDDLVQAKDREVDFLRSKLERMESSLGSLSQKDYTVLQRELGEKEQLVRMFEHEKTSALRDARELRLQLEKEMGSHKNTQQLLAETLQQRTTTAPVQPSPPNSDAVQFAVNLARSLPASFSKLPVQRKRALSAPGTTHKVPLREQASLTFDLQGESGRVVTADLKSLAMQDKSVKAQVLPTCEVSFTPEVRGWHKLKLSVNGYDTSSCDVFVEQPIEKIETPVKVIKCRDSNVSRICCSNKLIYYADQPHQKYHILDVNSEKVLEAVWCKRAIKCITVDADGYIYFTSNHKLHKFSPRGAKLAVFGEDSAGSGDCKLNQPEGLAVEIPWGHIHVCDSRNGRVVMFDSDLNVVGRYGEGISTKIKVPKSGDKPGHLQGPVAIAIRDDGKAFVLDGEKKAVVVFKNRVYDFIIWLDRTTTPVSLCFRESYLLVVDWVGHGLSMYSKPGDRWELVRKMGVEGSPVDVCTDPDGFIYIADSTNNVLMVY